MTNLKLLRILKSQPANYNGKVYEQNASLTLIAHTCVLVSPNCSVVSPEVLNKGHSGEDSHQPYSYSQTHHQHPWALTGLNTPHSGCHWPTKSEMRSNHHFCS